MADFGNPEVQEYFSKILDRYIRTLQLAYIRWDSNLHDIDAFWTSQDGPNRRGISEIRHIEGVRRVEQFVRDRHPEVILESCAGGGRRIDLVTLENRHTTWISDATAGASIIRFHLEGLNHIIPGSRQLVAFAPAERVFAKPDFVFPDMDCQCCFAGAFGTAGKLHLWPEAMKQRMRQHVEVYKKLRRYLAEDFYLLIPQSQTLDTWAKKHRCYVICPIKVRDGERTFNSAVLIDRSGAIVGRYDKIRPTEGELKRSVCPGAVDPPVFQTDFGAIGSQICFDVNWHSQWRRLNEGPALDLSEDEGRFGQRWYNPRTGEFEGPLVDAAGAARVRLGKPPREPGSDWAVLIEKAPSPRGRTGG